MSKVRLIAAALAAITLAATLVPASLEAASEHEITVAITKIKAVGRADTYSKGDFYAKVTIDGVMQQTQFIRQDSEVTPDWKITKAVKPGSAIPVKIEILDKDVSKDDPIDINRLGSKRDLDFTVNTKKCRVGGFANTYKCGRTISRTGDEDKNAELSFVVTVKK